MSYNSKHGITEVRKGKISHLDISLDYDTDESKKYPVFLFTPVINNTDDHYHIELTYKEAKVLNEWLNSYLNDYRDTAKK